MHGAYITPSRYYLLHANVHSEQISIMLSDLVQTFAFMLFMFVTSIYDNG